MKILDFKQILSAFSLYFFTLPLIITLNAKSSFAGHSVDLNELQTGDIILQPLHCWVCSLIEAQEKSEFSHIGIVLKNHKKEVFVIEAFNKVRMVRLSEFLKKTQKNKFTKVLRFKEKRFHDVDIWKEALSYIGLPYDDGFRWDNYNEKGLEKIYCSELVYKVFQAYYRYLPLKRMKFDINNSYWEKYFNGNVPYNEIGVSPGDFERSHLFLKLGTLLW